MSRLVPLEGERLSVGRGASNDLVVPGEMSSRLHAVLERFGDEWSVRDLGSSNGTAVNGERIWSAHVLRPGDAITIGQTKLIFRTSGAPAEAVTKRGEDLGKYLVTPRERDVLVALCRPLMTGRAFREPASTREVAQALFITEAAVRQHISSLCEKLQITVVGDRRRGELANEAVGRGLVTPADLVQGGEPPG